MKKTIVFLIEKESKYIIINDKSIEKWKLPTVVSDFKNYSETLKYKYGYEVKYCKKILEKKNICFIKVRYIRGKLKQNFKCKSLLISEIVNKNILSNKLQKKLITYLYHIIQLEALNDALWLGIISKISFKIKDYNKKRSIVNFMIFFSTIFCGEVLNYKLGEMSGKRKVTAEEIKELRNNNLKDIPTVKSNTTKKIINEMGINFNEYAFDIVLFFIDDKLVDINSRTWDYNKIENYELLNGCINTPYRWIENQFPEKGKEMWNQCLKASEKIIKKIEESDYKYKSYSTFKLFTKKNITESDKIYIIQRYGLIQSTIYIDELLSKGYENIETLSYKNFIRKVKAIIIEMIWNDRKNTIINIIDEIFNMNKKDIPDCFYSINRKCRNNIHYGDYQVLTEEEIKILDKYQNLYLNNIIKVFNKTISYKFGTKYKIAYMLAKVRYWASH